MLKSKKQTSPSEPFNPKLISKTRNLWNSRPRLNQETQFPTNWMSKDDIGKKHQFKIPVKVIKITRIKFCRKKIHRKDGVARKNQSKKLSQIKQIEIKRMRTKLER